MFSEIEEHSMQFWKSTMYYLMMEYKGKTVIPAPFNVIQVLLEMLACTVSGALRLASRVRARKGLYFVPTFTIALGILAHSNLTETHNSGSE